jgi:endonuclease/exonuclease/phosphatase family metal-dependent hydrolase
MPGILFWNLRVRTDADRIAREAAVCERLTRLARWRAPELFVFTECAIPDDVLGATLNAAGTGTYVCPPPRTQRIRVWTRLPAHRVVSRYNGAVRFRITIREVTLDGGLPFLLVGAHLLDRRRITTEAGRADRASQIAEEICRIEDKREHTRTVLIGDLNMNPYEAGVVGTRALHSVMTRDLTTAVAGLKERAQHRCFYNPMWARFGDGTVGPPGTYYWDNADEPTNHFWQMYDQVLVRPAMMQRVSRVEILDHDGVESLLTANGRPRSGTVSDHLPIYCELDGNTEGTT